ncbi:protein GOLM2 [Thunnus thynnus]|uniref:protein GOLM2 n=1 Tax=Thunnus thynnus TaxID=8237 RepID=UPI003527A4E7
MTAASSQKARNVVLALLAIWSIVSLIVIVVWATSPDLKSSAQCRAELQGVRKKLEDTEVEWKKDKVALEEQVENERKEQERLIAENLLLLANLNTTNATLDGCRQENLVLNGNISALLEEVGQLRQTETNLTARLGLQEDHIDALQYNLTQARHQTQSCMSLKAAAQSETLAAKSETKACESSQEFIQKQLHKCKQVESEAPQQTQKDPSDSAMSTLAGVPALTLLVCSSLHLIT